MNDPVNVGTYGANESAMQTYIAEGHAKAMALPNRGPVRYDENGAVASDIIDAYWRYGFYILEGVLGDDELIDLQEAIEVDIIQRLPVSRDASSDAQGRPALANGLKAPVLFWSKPLGDPFGGTDEAGGRHPVKMVEPQASADAPDDIVYLMLGPLQFSAGMLRTYGHPDLLSVAAAINGNDFVPFNEAVFIKEPGLGASVAWHQDGLTHWNSAQWDEGSHGFNFMGQLYGCTAANAVWVIPGSHKLGKIDIAARVAAAGTERLPDGVPIVCNPGDVAMSNRQIVHGSFANTSSDRRITLNMGFHRRSSVEGVTGGGLHAAPATYDDAHIAKRSRVIGYAIDARAQRFPDEVPFRYEPFADQNIRHAWDDTARASMPDYNLLDMSI